uniref:Uncharacterized protein n=1 Tax=Glossina austeni TaxID=7395 RepID=A0A1A9VCH6_GLOAU
MDSDVIEVAAGIVDTNLNCEDFHHHVTDHFTELNAKTMSGKILSRGINSDEDVSYGEAAVLFNEQGINTTVWLDVNPFTLDIETMIDVMNKLIPPPPPPPPPAPPCILANEYHTLKEISCKFFIDPSSLEAVIKEASLAVYVRDINKANNHQKAVQSRREEALQSKKMKIIKS